MRLSYKPITQGLSRHRRYYFESASAQVMTFQTNAVCRSLAFGIGRPVSLPMNSSETQAGVQTISDVKKGLSISRKSLVYNIKVGGRWRLRTSDPCSVNAVLYP